MANDKATPRQVTLETKVRREKEEEQREQDRGMAEARQAVGRVGAERVGEGELGDIREAALTEAGFHSTEFLTEIDKNIALLGRVYHNLDPNTPINIGTGDVLAFGEQVKRGMPKPQAPEYLDLNPNTKQLITTAAINMAANTVGLITGEAGAAVAGARAIEIGAEEIQKNIAMRQTQNEMLSRGYEAALKTNAATADKINLAMMEELGKNGREAAKLSVDTWYKGELIRAKQNEENRKRIMDMVNTAVQKGEMSQKDGEIRIKAISEARKNEEARLAALGKDADRRLQAQRYNQMTQLQTWKTVSGRISEKHKMWKAYFQNLGKSDIPMYSQNINVVGDRIQNANPSQVNAYQTHSARPLADSLNNVYGKYTVDAAAANPALVDEMERLYKTVVALADAQAEGDFVINSISPEMINQISVQRAYVGDIVGPPTEEEIEALPARSPLKQQFSFPLGAIKFRKEKPADNVETSVAATPLYSLAHYLKQTIDQSSKRLYDEAGRDRKLLERRAELVARKRGVDVEDILEAEKEFKKEAERAARREALLEEE